MSVQSRQQDTQAVISRTYVPELDGLRGIAVLMVVFAHYVGYLIFESYNLTHTHTNFQYELMKMGWAGVDLFFVLSGFLIGGILLDGLKTSSVPQTSSKLEWMRRFYRRRFFRIIPPYFALLFLFLVVVKTGQFTNERFFGKPGFPVWPYFTFFQNYFLYDLNPGRPMALAHVWSLAIEEQFYLIFPWFVLWFRGRLLWVAILAAAIGIISAGLRYDSNNILRHYMLTQYRLDGLAFGVLIACFIRSSLYTKFKPWIGPAAIGFFGLTLVSIGTHYSEIIFGQARIHLELAFLSGASVFLAWHYRGYKALSWLRGRGLIFFGKISYMLYLVHFMILGIVLGLFTETGEYLVRSFYDASLVFLAFIVSILFCVASRKWFELPLQRLARKT